MIVKTQLMDSMQEIDLLIWDKHEPPPKNSGDMIYWQSYYEYKDEGVYSVPHLVEQNAEQLRDQYLSFIYNIGKKKINGRSIIEHMQIREGFNYWWMTLIVEKCNFAKSPQIDNAIKLLAFKTWLQENDYKQIRLISHNTALADAIKMMAYELSIGFKWQKVKKQDSKGNSIKSIYRSLPHSLQAIVWLIRRLFSRWSLRGAGLKEWKSSNGEITFFSYFFNLVPESAKKGHYESRYWAHLPDLLIQKDISTNWLHLYVKYSVLPSAKKAAELIGKFNKSGENKQTHATLDTFLGWKVIWNTLSDWVNLFKAGSNLKGLSSLKIEDGVYLWPFLEIDLKESLCGHSAIRNLLNFNLFEEALRLLPNQKKGVCLQENQEWEFGLIQAWRAKAHGDFIGVPHSMVRFWDLRYFFDSRSYKGNISNQLPRPSKVAVHGKLARKMYLQGGYPKNELIDVEALRYLYLNTDGEKKNNFLNNNPIVILVLGDYLAENTYYLMRILEEAYSSFSSSIKLFIKPHPNCPIIPSEYPRLKMEVTVDSISSLLSKCTVAYTSNVTSAAIDAYCANVPVISALNPQTLNMSPLRGIEGVEFVSNAGELVNAIKKIKTNHHNKTVPENIFWLDPKLPMWKNLLDVVNHTRVKYA